MSTPLPKHTGLFRNLTRLRHEQFHTPPPRRGRRRFIKRLVLTPAVLLFLLLIAAFVFVLSLRQSMRSSLPQLDGDLRVPGIAAPVTITRDEHGVPSITASSLDDLLFAQGYITASDRLFQMDALRRHAAGELAEILGPSLVAHDRMQRYLQLRAVADRATAALTSDQLHQLQAYARGVNAWIAASTAKGREPGSLPVEFHLLHYTPSPWSPRDTLLISLVMAQDLSTSFPQKLNREALSAHLPANLIADLYPTSSWRDRPPTQTSTDLTAPTDAIEQIPLDESQSRLITPGSAANLTASTHDLFKVSSFFTSDIRAGSNNWAVAASHSASGAPLVSNDMHLQLSVPDIWYEAVLHTRNPAQPLDAAGFTLPGVPFVIAGRNAHVAWGFTNTGADVQDLRIEHLRGPAANPEYARPDGTWAAVHHHKELIRVRAGHDVTLDVLTTTHAIGSTQTETPIISPLYPSERRALSLAWYIYDPATVTSPFLAIDTAKDAASLVAAFASFGGPSESLVYADAQHIGFHALGRVPVRGPAVQHPRITEPSILSSPDSTADFIIGNPISPVPVDALDPGQAWSGYIPYDALPAVLDPSSGLLATANARITPDHYHYYFANDWADAYRVERISRLLEGRSKLTPADMLAVQTDTHSEMDLLTAQRLAYAIDHASQKTLGSNAKQLHQASDILRRWSGNVTPDSPAAAIVFATRTSLWPMLLQAQVAKLCPPESSKDSAACSAKDLTLLYTCHSKITALELVLQHTPARWLPPAYANWDDLLTTAVAQSLAAFHAPRDLATWRYSALRTMEIAHPILGSNTLLSHALGLHTGTGQQPIAGDNTTVQQIGDKFGPSQRLTADLASAETTQANITTGQSGNPASLFYLDQFDAWLHGTTFTLPLSRPTPVHTLKLVPVP